MAKLTVDLASLRRAQAKLERIGRDLEREKGRILRDIGEELVASTQGRFLKTKTAPDGEPWQALKPSTIRRKKNKSQILIEDGTLWKSVHAEVHGNTLLVGSPMKYAATHQVGNWIEIPEQTRVVHFRTKDVVRKNEKGERVTIRRKGQFSKELKTTRSKTIVIPNHVVEIPARPYLGISSEDRTAIDEIVEAHLKRILGA